MLCCCFGEGWGWAPYFASIEIICLFLRRLILLCCRKGLGMRLISLEG